MLILMSNKQKQFLYMSLEKPWMSPSDHLELLVCYGDQLILLALV